MRKNILSSLISFVFLMCGMQVSAGGNDLSIQVEGNQYSIEGSDSESSLSLKMNGGETTELKVLLSNAGDEDAKVDVAFNDAQTTNEGQITYSTNDKKFSKYETTPLSKMITGYPKTVEIKAGKTEEVIFKLKVPKGSFNGIKLGGIHFINSVSSSEADKMFKNRFAYSVPVLLTQSDEQIQADTELQSVENVQDNKKNYLEIKIDNISRAILSRGIFKLDLYKGEEKIFSNEKDALEIAPMSTYPYRMQWSDNYVTSGAYTAKFSLDTPYGVWKWEEEFEITKKEAEKLNNSAIHVEKSSNLLMIVIVAAVFIVLLGVIVYMLKKMKDSKK